MVLVVDNNGHPQDSRKSLILMMNDTGVYWRSRTTREGASSCRLAMRTASAACRTVPSCRRHWGYAETYSGEAAAAGDAQPHALPATRV